MTYTQLRPRLKALNGSRLEYFVDNLLQIKTIRDPKWDQQEAPVAEVMLLGVANWIYSWLPSNEIHWPFLLVALKDDVIRHGVEVEAVLDLRGRSPNLVDKPGVEWTLRPFQIGFADAEYATWTGFQKFHVVSTGEILEALPITAVFTVQLDVNALYFRIKDKVDGSRLVGGGRQENREAASDLPEAGHG